MGGGRAVEQAGMRAGRRVGGRTDMLSRTQPTRRAGKRVGERPPGGFGQRPGGFHHPVRSFHVSLPSVERAPSRDTASGRVGKRLWSAVFGRASGRARERARSGGQGGGGRGCRAAGSTAEQGCLIRLPAFRMSPRGRATAPRVTAREYRDDAKTMPSLAACPEAVQCARVFRSRRAGRARDATARMKRLRRNVVFGTMLASFNDKFTRAPVASSSGCSVRATNC